MHATDTRADMDNGTMVVSINSRPYQTENVFRTHAKSGESALLYISIILSCYVVGLLILLLHHVRQKYGQITMYDVYLELAPSRWTGIRSAGTGLPHTTSGLTTTNTSSSRDLELHEDDEDEPHDYVESGHDPRCCDLLHLLTSSSSTGSLSGSRKPESGNCRAEVVVQSEATGRVASVSQDLMSGTNRPSCVIRSEIKAKEKSISWKLNEGQRSGSPVAQVHHCENGNSHESSRMIKCDDVGLIETAL